MQTANAYTGPSVPVRLPFAALHTAWVKARRGKRPGAKHLRSANHAGKVSHTAVDRLHAFMRQRNGQVWLLFRCLDTRMRSGGGGGGALRSLCHKLLAQPVQEWCTDPPVAAKVPPHKCLRNATAGCGLPIGNLTSQFFADVYLNDLDQFVKHTLKSKHYLRYVDDFVMLAPDAATLRQWHAQIAQFLQERLRLRLKDEHRLAPVAQGVDFLGYELSPSHRLVRRRVMAHCKGKVNAWAQRHVSGNAGVLRIRATPESLAHLQHLLASYWGHFAHTRSVRHAPGQCFAWLKLLFHINPAGDLSPRWVLQGSSLGEQVAWLRNQWPHAVCSVQKGCETLRFAPLKTPDGSRVHAKQIGWLRHGTRRREIIHFQIFTENTP